MNTLKTIASYAVWAVQWFVKREPTATHSVLLAAGTGLFTWLGLGTATATSVAASLVPLVIGGLLRAGVSPPWPKGTKPVATLVVAPAAPAVPAAAPPFPTPEPKATPKAAPRANPPG